MTPLEELLLKWRDRSLTLDEWAELNAWLSTAEGRARLREEFSFDANLIEAIQIEKARVTAQEQARAFESIEVGQSDVFENGLPRAWLAWLRRFDGLRWKFAWVAAAGIVLAGTVFLLAVRKETIAHLEDVARGVTVVRGGKPIAVASGLALKSSDQIQTSKAATATVVYLKEATRIELHGATQLRLQSTNAAKRLELLQGSITAKIAPQPKGQLMLVTTPHAEAHVLGTEFLLLVDAESSRVEVLEGAVQFVNREDGLSVMVNSGFFALAAKGVELVARSLVPEPWHSQDIGEVGLAGTARLDGQRCLAKGAGRNTCLTKDQFHFVYQTLDGDGEIIARVVNLDLAQREAKAGVVIRESLKPAAPHAFLFLRPDSSVEFERRAKFESKANRVGTETAPYWVRLVRKGDIVRAYKSPNGTTWTQAGWETIKMGKRIYVGLGVTSWDNSALATSMFDNVKVLTASR